MLLTRGPRFMIRKDIDLNEFIVDVEKMVVKQDYNDSDGGNLESDGVEWSK